YIILRKEFEKNEKNKKKQKKIEKILITLGGTDIRNLTPKLLKKLKNIDGNFKIKVVIGNNYSNVEEILGEKTSNVKLLYNLEALQMKEEMEASDLVISACGQTIYELLVVGVSFIPIVIIENQLNNAKSLKNLKIFDKILDYTEIDKDFDFNLKNKETEKIKIGTNKILSILIGERDG
ncbi:MAG: glycosyltransferase, partial [Cetobacterium sp.]